MVEIVRKLRDDYGALGVQYDCMVVADYENEMWKEKMNLSLYKGAFIMPVL